MVKFGFARAVIVVTSLSASALAPRIEGRILEAQ